jgi:hypothetical protein
VSYTHQEGTDILPSLHSINAQLQHKITELDQITLPSTLVGHGSRHVASRCNYVDGSACKATPSSISMTGIDVCRATIEDS